MSLLKVLFCVALGCILLSNRVEAACEVCSMTNYAACINSTAFAVCLDGMNKSNQVKVCPDGQVCTANQGVCGKIADGAVPACVKNSGCRKCSNLFACVSQTEFAYCDTAGGLGIVASCEAGKVCNVEQFAITNSICSYACAFPPTCPNTEIVTVPPPVLDWKLTCVIGAPTSYYQNIYDPTCKTYVYCEYLSGTMNAVLYNCTNGYFSSATKKCETTKPTGCK